jgi:hypothetical protein
MTENQEENQDQKIENQNINRGVELMLRRKEENPKRKGFKVSKRLNLLSKIFSLKIELTWE